MDLLYLYCHSIHSYTTTNTRTRGVGVAFNSSTRGITPYHYDNANARRWRQGGLEFFTTTLPPLVDGNEEDWHLLQHCHLLRHCHHSSTVTRRIGILYYDIVTTRRWQRGGSASILTITFTTLPALVDGDEIGITTLPPLVDGDEEDWHSLLRHCHHSSMATRTIGIYYYYYFYDIASTRRRQRDRYYDIASTRRWRRGGLAFFTTILPPLVDGDEEDRHLLLLSHLGHCQHSSKVTRSVLRHCQHSSMATRRIGIYSDIASTRRRRQGW